MIIKWYEDAIADLELLENYISQDNPLAAQSMVDKIVQAINLLSDQSEIGRLGRIASTRELIIPGTSYIAAYTVINQSILILRVLHSARQWPEEF